VKTRWVYAFGGGSADGDASMKNLLGGKGANLAEMSRSGLPVPPGFTITTEACVPLLRQRNSLSGRPEGAGGRRPEDGRADHRQDVRRRGQPLLVSVRSGARALDAGDDGHGR
jgi:pyruvate,orthophosphate dikinase